MLNLLSAAKERESFKIRKQILGSIDEVASSLTSPEDGIATSLQLLYYHGYLTNCDEDGVDTTKEAAKEASELPNVAEEAKSRRE